MQCTGKELPAELSSEEKKEALLQAMSTLSWNQLPTIPGVQPPDPEVARVATLPMQVPVL